MGEEFVTEDPKFEDEAEEDIISKFTLRSKDTIDASRITRRIFLGSYSYGACDRNGIKMMGITHNLMIGNSETMPLPFPDEIVYKFVELDDHHTEAIEEHFDECINFIDNALKHPRTKVLVNCWAGVSRSATIVIAYLMVMMRMNYLEAYETVRKARHWIKPNRGFRSKLINLSAFLGRPVTSKQVGRYEHARMILYRLYEKDGMDMSEEINVQEIFEDIFGTYHIHRSDIDHELLLRK